MSGIDPARQRDEAKAWLAKADEDLAAVRACLDAKPALLGVAAYHCQQAAEKLIKGLLVLTATPFRKTHDLDELSAAALPLYPDLEPLLAYLRVRTTGALPSATPCRPIARAVRPQRARSRRCCATYRNSALASPPQRALKTGTSSGTRRRCATCDASCVAFPPENALK